MTLPLGLKHTENAMKFRVRFAHQIVGVFVLLAILAVAAILVLLGINQRWFAKDYYYWSVFKSAGGLSVGMPIRLKGFEIGRISTISLTRDNLVEIEFFVMDTYYDKVLPSSVLELSSNPLGLGGGMFFHPGKGPAEPLPEFSYVPSMDLEEGKQLVKNGLVDRPVGEDPIGEVIASLGPILVQVDSTLASIEQMVQSLDDSITGVGSGPLAGVIVELETVAGQINDVLEELEKLGIITLPALVESQKRGPQKAIAWTPKTDEQALIDSNLKSISPIHLCIASDKQDIELFNEFIDRYHYLGYRRPIGSHLRYFIVDRNGCKLGCLSFCFATQTLPCRDQWIGWSNAAKQKRLNLVINNNRFLIFPWVRVKNLASKALSMACRQLPQHWQTHHGYRPVLAESFIDSNRYLGVCYRAANWQHVGYTAGKKANGSIKGKSKKAVYL